MADPFRLAFVGYGSIASAHTAAFRRLPNVEPVWVVGRDPEATAAFAQEWDFPRWTLDLNEALHSTDAPVDGVVITSPSDMHADQTELCLRAGKHVLAEIPLATNLSDAERVAKAAQETGLRVQVAHTQRYLPALLELRRRLAAGELRPHHLVCRWFFLRRDNVNWMGRCRTWTDNLLWHHGCHVVDAALWLLGGDTPPEVTAVQAQFGPPHPTLGIPLDLDVQFRVGETLVTVAMSYNSAWPRHEYFVIGEEGSVEFRDGKLWGAEGALFVPDPEDKGIQRQNAEWLEAIRAGREPAVNAGAVLPAMRALHAAELSA